MKAMIWTAAKQMDVMETDLPEIQQNEVLIQVKTVGICGSDLEGYLGHNSLRIPPLQMGHEFSGVIKSIGSDVRKLKPGNRVVVNPLITCGECLQCKRGLDSLCEVRKIIGIHRPGSYAEYVAVPAANVYLIEDHLTFDAASLTEPLACSLRATRRAMAGRPLPNVVIIGAGSIGLLSGFVAKLLGASKVFILDVNEIRLQTAGKLGFDGVLNSSASDIVEKLKTLVGYKGIDVIVDAVGMQVTRELAIKLINPGGTIMNIGLGIDLTGIPVNHLIRFEIEIKGSFCYANQDFVDALQLLTDGKVTEQGWSLIRPLDEGPNSFAELTSGKSGVGKILLHP